MYLIEWMARPRTHALVVDSTDMDFGSLEEAMDRAKKLFSEVRRKHPNVTGYRICKTGEPVLFEWWSPNASGSNAAGR